VSVLAIIPARGGSKRIPRKNIKDFMGKPIIAYSIETSIKSGLFDRVIVSTDDREIAEISKGHGAEVPFFRSPENSNDNASTVDVLLEVLEKLIENGEKYDILCCLYPTSPLLDYQTLLKSLESFKKNKVDSLVPVVKFSYPPQRALTLNSGLLKMETPENLNMRSQDLKPLYHDAGQFYWIKVDTLLKEKKLFTNRSGAYELSEKSVQDIDNPIDWEMAEFKFEFLRAKNE
jgi:N-acylneuraminate cytidylyltransferase